MFVRLLVALLSLSFAAEGQKIKVLIVDGINNHDWRAGTRFLKSTLESAGIFVVDVSTTPDRDTAPAAWDTWRPDFSAYDAVINNFNGGHKEDGVRWPRPVEEAFIRYLRNGGGVVLFHAANNAFLLWPEYNELAGLLWRDKAYGPGLVVDIGKKTMTVAAGEGPQPGHGPRHDFRIDVLDREHPITRGLGPGWMHRSEQLTHGQHGLAAEVGKLRVLTYAYSKDSQRNEPMDWTRSYGRGRVYVTMLGHTWVGEENPNLDEPEFRDLFGRAVEWAATGRVSLARLK